MTNTNAIELKEPLNGSELSDDSPHAAVLDPFPTLLMNRRKERGWSQDTLSKKSGVSHMQISRLESGKHMPSIRTLIKLAPYLGYSLDDLLLASSYTGATPCASPTYVGFAGERIELEQAAEHMYQIDSELFLRIHDFFSHYYSPENGEFLKTVLHQIVTETKYENVSDEEPTSKTVKRFSQMFAHVKALVISLGQMLEDN